MLKRLLSAYFKKSTTFESGKKCTPVLGRREPYLFLSSSDASRGDSSSFSSAPPFEMRRFSKLFISFRKSSKLIWPLFSSGQLCRSRLYIKSMASVESLPSERMIVCKSPTSIKPVFSLSNISKMHLKFSISSSEYFWKMLVPSFYAPPSFTKTLL